MISTQCVLWDGPMGPRGYGRVTVNGRRVLAHRHVYQKFHGPLGEREVVRHTCDNPLCVNPYHLESGTQADNVRDMVARGRQAKGEGHGQFGARHPFFGKRNERLCQAASLSNRGEGNAGAVLTDDLVRIAVSEGWSRAKLAVVGGCSKQSAYEALTGRTWKHIHRELGLAE